MALPKANRLRRRQDFSAVYRSGNRRRSNHLTLITMRRGQSKSDRSCSTVPDQKRQSASNHPPYLRIGVSINLKVSKRAVVRNRLKRQVHAVFRHLLPQLSSGWDLVVVLQPQAIRCDYFQFLQELEQLLTDAEIYHGH